MLSQEKNFLTRLIRDAAIPNAYSIDVYKSFCVFAIVPFKLRWKSEKASVRLVFLVISPKDDPAIHLNILAGIASEYSIVHKLLRSETFQNFVEKLQKARKLQSN
ncbi:MAG TPA: hypothetical protein DGB85_07125 [Deltaproteobacteria bacterium]|nr:hypothetical protein [Deltaproteobacteria bacterium]